MTYASSAQHYQDLISFVKSEDNKLQDRIRHPDRMVNALAEDKLGHYRSAAVLIPVTRLSDDAESHVVLTVRSADLKSHPGQISFPGGTVEAQDKDSVATALRETQEEIGVHPNNVEVIGRISDIALPSGYRVTPVVGIIDNNLNYLANPAEVEAIFHAPLSLLLDPKAYKRSAVAYQDVERAVLELHYGEYRIWGATAAILYHLASHI